MRKLVLKYWSIDDAAAPLRNRSPSTIGAMMDEKYHSTKVMLDVPLKDWMSSRDGGEERFFDICSESGWKRGSLVEKGITVTVVEITAVFG